MISIIDYGAGNLNSVEKAFRSVGIETSIVSKPKEVMKATSIVLPGVGAFGEAMKKLKQLGLKQAIQEKITEGTPFLGICLGLQLLFEYSEEGKAEGIGILQGTIQKFSKEEGLKIPHMGWNIVEKQRHTKLWEGIKNNPYFYFVHSYFHRGDETIVTGKTKYIESFDAIIEKNNVYATQFHPEKSGAEGLRLLKNFADISQKGENQ